YRRWLFRNPTVEHEFSTDPEQSHPVMFPHRHTVIPIPPFRTRDLRRQNCQPAVRQHHDGDSGRGVMNNLQLLTRSGNIERSLAENAGGRWNRHKRRGIFKRHTGGRRRCASSTNQQQLHEERKPCRALPHFPSAFSILSQSVLSTLILA